jgi:hypothetical protein
LTAACISISVISSNLILLFCKIVLLINQSFEYLILLLRISINEYEADTDCCLF